MDLLRERVGARGSCLFGALPRSLLQPLHSQHVALHSFTVCWSQSRGVQQKSQFVRGLTSSLNLPDVLEQSHRVIKPFLLATNTVDFFVGHAEAAGEQLLCGPFEAR